MNKKELIMAQKAYMSRQVKNETIAINMSRSPSKGKPLGHVHSLPDIGSPQSLSKSMTSLFSPMQSHHASHSSLGGTQANQLTNNEFETTRAQTAFSLPHNGQGLDTQELKDLYAEIKQRTLTPSAMLRKCQATISKEIRKDIVDDSENRYMPKVTLLRADGSSLNDIYSSKREDMWAKIMKAQLAEEEERKLEERKAKLKAHDEFGSLLKRQVDDCRERARQTQSMDKIYATMEPETTKKMAEAQAKRDQIAAESRKQFIGHALEDAKLARERRERAMRQEIEDSQIMVMKAKAMIAEEERQKELKKEREAARLAALAEETVETIKRRAREKQLKHEEEKKTALEALRQSIERENRRKEDVANISNRVTNGPAFKLVAEINRNKIEQEKDMYDQIARANNCLNRQLQQSEKAAFDRSNANTQYLADDWTRQIKIHKEEAAADAIRVEKIGEVMKQTIKQMELEDEINRQKKHEAHMKYQRDLDSQLAHLRARSIQSLKETMTPSEMKYNSDLIRKASKYAK